MFRIGLDPQRSEAVFVRLQQRERMPILLEGLAIIPRVEERVAGELAIGRARAEIFGGLLLHFLGAAAEVFAGQAEVLLGERHHALAAKVGDVLAGHLHPLADLLADLVGGEAVVPAQLQDIGGQVGRLARPARGLFGGLAGGAGNELLDALVGPEEFGPLGEHADLDGPGQVGGNELLAQEGEADGVALLVVAKGDFLAGEHVHGKLDAEETLVVGQSAGAELAEGDLHVGEELRSLLPVLDAEHLAMQLVEDILAQGRSRRQGQEREGEQRAGCSHRLASEVVVGRSLMGRVVNPRVVSVVPALRALSRTGGDTSALGPRLSTWKRGFLGPGRERGLDLLEPGQDRGLVVVATDRVEKLPQGLATVRDGWCFRVREVIAEVSPVPDEVEVGRLAFDEGDQAARRYGSPRRPDGWRRGRRWRASAGTPGRRGRRGCPPPARAGRPARDPPGNRPNGPESGARCPGCSGSWPSPGAGRRGCGR